MQHYYSQDNDLIKSNEKLVYVNIKEKKLAFLTDHGVFSKSGLDFGSRLLIETVIDIKAENVLDVGCGYGPIGIAYKMFNPEANLVMTDVNDRALKLAKKNTELNRIRAEIYFSDSFSEIDSEFNLILTNPPIRAGKKVIYQIFSDAHQYLKAEGQLIFVMNKKHGAPSAIKECESIYSLVEVINKKSGYYIIKCIK
jgi:16S rRNA (guanine1207-N2)-methyltransferase